MTKIWLWLADNGNVRKWDFVHFKEGAETKANPGGDVARKVGCKCPVMDNGCGNDELGRVRGFYITQGCPVHDRRTSTGVA